MLFLYNVYRVHEYNLVHILVQGAKCIYTVSKIQGAAKRGRDSFYEASKAWQNLEIKMADMLP